MEDEIQLAGGASSSSPSTKGKQKKFHGIRGLGKKVTKTATGFWSSFHAFVDRGNVLDLAIALIVGAAFTAVVTSLVNDILTPPLSLAIGKTLENNFVMLKNNGTKVAYATLA